MRNKRKLAVIIIIVGLILMILGIILGTTKKTATPKENIKYDNFDVDENLTIDMCIAKENCDINPEAKYHLVTLKNAPKNFKTIIEQINKTTKNNYNNALSSTLEDPACALVKDKYKHSLIYYVDYNLFENSEFIIIDTKREETNLCTKESKIQAPEVYVFQKEKQKIITQSEFRKELDVTDIEIENAIKENIQILNELDNTSYTYENTFQEGKQNLTFYYTIDGTLYTYYFQNEDQKYHAAKID